MSVRTLIKAPRLFDAVSEQCTQHAFVVIDDERIDSVGAQRDLGGNADEQFDRVIDLPADSTLLPGLINMHTHLSFSSSMQVFSDAISDSDAAQALGLDDIGTIAAQKAADLLVVNGDPLNNIRDIERTAMVFVRGERVVNNGNGAAV